jgi:urease accessory protein
MEGRALPGIEPMIAVSLMALGLLIAAMVELPLAAGAAIIAAFGLFHGNAHGLEAPVSGASALYGLGFVLSTTALHLSGLGLGWGARRLQVQPLLRGASAVIAVTGGVMLFA